MAERRPSQNLFIADVRSWDLMESEALGFLNEGEIEGVRQTVTTFIDNSCKDCRMRCKKDEIEPEERRRRETLAFVFKFEFEKAPVEEQKRLIKEACSKAPRYSVLQEQTWREFASAKTFDKMRRAGKEADAVVVKMDLKAFHEGETFFEQAQAKINGILRRKAFRAKYHEGERE